MQISTGITQKSHKNRRRANIMKLQTKSTAITNASIETRTNECGCTYYQVIGDTERFGIQEILFEGVSKEDAEKYIETYTEHVEPIISKSVQEKSSNDIKDLIKSSLI